MNLLTLSAASVPLAHHSPRFAWLRLLFLLAPLAAGSAQLIAQQPYPYPGQQPMPYGYAQPQYAQPQQYADPQYAQPQAPQPQYAQPQYGQPQYPQPQYAQPQYGQQQPYAQQPPEQPAYPQQDPQMQLDQMEQPQGNQQAQPPLNPDELDQLVAPIALYPDALLAQILTASTYPAQVSVAGQWLQQMQAQGYGSPSMVASGADAQSDWDPSIKALTAFPQVLDMMNSNLEWTTALGNAYYNQPQDVMQTVQVMRERAAAAGNLQATPQESVSNDQGNIELAPANPQEVYVPVYDPWDIYGQPVSPYPGFSFTGALGSFFGGPPISYGLGFALAAFERFPWGFLGWAFDWHGHDVLFGHGSYFTHSNTVADWGFPHGGPRAFNGRFQSARLSNNDRGSQPYNRGVNGFDRGQLSDRSAQSLSRPAQQFNRPMQSPVRPPESLARPEQQFNRAQPSTGAYGSQRGETFNRGYGAPGNSYMRPESPSQEAYNRVPPSYARPQPYAGAQAYGRSPYESGYANRPAQPFATRPGTAFGGQSYRVPQQAAPRAFAQAQPRGFQPFGRVNPSSGFSGGRAPRGFSGGSARSFGSGGGGHFSAPKASHSSGGGGHSGGGGGHHGR